LNSDESSVASNTKHEFKIGQWRVLPGQNCLIKDGQTKSIEPQCMALLIFLAKHQGQVLSRAQLLDALWKNIVVNENTLTKTVGMLRQALEDDAKNPQYIITRLKKGYQLITPVIELGENESSNKVELAIVASDKKTNNLTVTTLSIKPWLKKIVVVTLLALLFIIIWQVLAGSMNQTASYSKFSPITFGVGIERDPNFSPDGQFLVYSARKNNTANFNLAIYSLKQQISVDISDFSGDELAPAFSPDGTNIAYFHKSDAVCHLYVSKFNYPNPLTKGKKVANCGYNNQGQIHWLDDDLLLFSDRNIDTMGEHKLYQLQLSSLYLKEIKNHYPFVFAVSPSKQTVAVLERHHGRLDLDINELLLQQKNSLFWLTGLNPYTEFAWFNDEKRLLITDAFHGRISIADKSGVNQQIYQANTMFSQPVVSPVSDVIAMVQAYIKSNLYQVINPLLQQETKQVSDYLATSKPLFASNYFDYLHQYSVDNQLAAFVSNRNGKHQLWISTSGTVRPVINELFTSADIIDFQWSPDASKILLMLSNGKVLLYTLKDNSALELPLGEDQLYFPVWDSQGNGVLFARMNEMGPKVLRYDLNNHSEQQITKMGAISIAVSPDGRYFYLLKLKSGLWQLDRHSGEEKLLLANVTSSAWGSLVAFNDGIYWQETSRTGYQIRHFNLDSAQSSTLIIVPQENSTNLRYFDVSKDQQHISFNRMYDYRSDLIFLSE
jgi:DNA-binding winged helix-turn-helix (wHTH) protein/Tol biopolymer transport system component